MEKLTYHHFIQRSVLYIFLIIYENNHDYILERYTISDNRKIFLKINKFNIYSITNISNIENETRHVIFLP